MRYKTGIHLSFFFSNIKLIIEKSLLIIVFYIDLADDCSVVNNIEYCGDDLYEESLLLVHFINLAVFDNLKQWNFVLL